MYCIFHDIIKEKQGDETVSIEKAITYLTCFGIQKKVLLFEQSTATVESAARALHTEEQRIAKTLSFFVEGDPVLVVVAGDARIDNKKFRNIFQEKAKMIPYDEVELHIGHCPGGVCPFGVKENVKTYLDVSLKRFHTIFPAAGSSNSAIELTPKELFVYAKSIAWIDICKDWVEKDKGENDGRIDNCVTD